MALCATASAFAAAPGAEVRLREHPKLVPPPLFGVCALFEDGAALPEPLTDEALRKALAPALDSGPSRYWRVEPGRGPIDFTVARLNPAHDGRSLDFAATDALVRIASENGDWVVPVLDSKDLAQLGASDPMATGPTPRNQFLFALACHYSGQGEGAAASRPAVPPILSWQLRIDVQATNEGPMPDAVRQWIADALALRRGSPGADVQADIGEFSTAGDPAALRQIRAFAHGPARPQLKGLSVGLKLERADFEQAIHAFALLRGAGGDLPVWVHSIRAGKGFDESVRSAPSAEVAWDPEASRAAYCSAIGAACLASSLGGAVFWDEAPATDTLAGNAMARAAGRLARSLQPYYRAKIENEGRVWHIEFNRDPDPASHVVFWDWASDPAQLAARDYTLPVFQNVYRVTPLVDDVREWSESREVAGDKLGLALRLGFGPLYIEPAHIGFARPVPLGAPVRYFRGAASRPAQPALKP
ncbi:MAG: hypothetical protein NTW86_09080 [Candidatus Sumerlaeota bacterium]|nr:hypothetical protein [Candidatus Sumerlaeota bacterium]